MSEFGKFRFVAVLVTLIILARNSTVEHLQFHCLVRHDIFRQLGVDRARIPFRSDPCRRWGGLARKIVLR